MKSNENEIIEYYRGVPIRRCYQKIVLKVSVVTYKKMIDIVAETGLPMAKVLAYSGQPCEKCPNACVIAFNKNDEPVKIKRGILPIPETNGINIIQQYKNKKTKA